MDSDYSNEELDGVNTEEAKDTHNSKELQPENQSHEHNDMNSEGDGDRTSEIENNKEEETKVKNKDSTKYGEPIMSRAFGQPVALPSMTSSQQESKEKLHSAKDRDSGNGESIIDRLSSQLLQRQSEAKHDAEIPDKAKVKFGKSRAETVPGNKVNESSLKLQRYEQVKNTKLFQKFLAKERENQRRTALENARKGSMPGNLSGDTSSENA